MNFAKPEHEFLRQMAMVEPDWEAMHEMAVVAMDYGELQRTALLHQLDGVLAWRLLDERLGAAVPEIVRDHWAQYDGSLDVANAQICEEMHSLLDGIEQGGWPYVIHGGPAQYLILGMTHWPRAWNDVDLEIDCSAQELQELIHFLGLEIQPSWPGIDLVECRFPSGTWIDFQWNRWEGWSFRDDVREVTMRGLTFNVPAPEYVVYYQAWQTGQQVLYKSRRLPLWGLARLKAWTGVPEFSWEAFGRLLATGPVPDPYDRHGNTPATKIVWALDKADEVYALYPPELNFEEYRSPIICGGIDDLGPAHAPLDGVPAGDVFDDIRAEWADEHISLEHLLFDLQEVEGPKTRIERGIWRKVGRIALHQRQPSGAWGRIIQDKQAD